MKLLFCSIFLFVSPFLFAQSTAFLPQLKSAFEPSYLQQIQQSNPILLKRWTYYATHAYYVTEDIPFKMAKSLQTIEVNPSHINIFLLEKQYSFLKRDWNKPIAYKIKNTNKLLVYYSGKHFMEAFHSWLATTAQ